MNRSDLESRVQIAVSPPDDRGARRMIASLKFDAVAYLDPIALAGAPEIDLAARIERHLRRFVVHEARGDMESTNARLRAAVEKWGRRAISRQFPSRERRNEQDAEEDELKEDLR